MSPDKWRLDLAEDVAIQRPDRADVTPRGRKARALLALLASEPGQQLNREAAIGLLWSDRGREQGLASLRQCLGELRLACAPVLDISHTRIALLTDRLTIAVAPGDRQLLAGLQRLDPTFDRWLCALRDRARTTAQHPPEALGTGLPAAPSIAGREVRWPAAVIAAGALAAAAVIIGRATVPAAQRAAAPPSIFVRTLAAGAGDDWAKGASDTVALKMIGMMPQAGATRVVAGRQPDVPNATSDPGDWVVESEVRRQPAPGIMIRIVSGSGTLLWSKIFTVHGGDITRLENDVTAATGSLVNCAAGAPLASRSDQSSMLLLAACDSLDGLDGWDADGSLPALRRFAEQAPDEAFPHALLGTGLAMAAATAQPPRDDQQRAAASAQLARAARLNDRVGLIDLGRSLLLPGSAPLRERETILARGLAIEPQNPFLNLEMADFLASVGRSDAAVDFARRALSNDPGRLRITSALAQYLAQAGQPRAALKLLDQARDSYSANPMLSSARFTILMRGGYPAAARAMLEPTSGVPDFIEPAEQEAMRRQSYAIEMPEGPEARQIASDLIAAAAADPATAGRPVLVLANLGRIDDAVRIALHDTVVTNVFFRPSSHALLTDRRFPQIARRQGLWAYWESTGHWPDVCREAHLAWRCGRH